MSTPLFEGIGEEMTPEEWTVSRSTPLCRFDAPAPTAPAPAVVEQKVAADPAATRLVAEIVDQEPVVMFALEWCEFCWAVRKLFAKLGIAYRSVDIDSVALQERDMGTKIRAVLKDRTGSPTIPQIYVGGKHVGGCMDLFDAMRAGRMRQHLDDAGVEYDRNADIDPYGFLPKWVHPRKTA
jgi:cysteine synthase A